MAEPTLQEVLDLITALRGDIAQISLAVDDARANLMLHRQDVGAKMTDMDLSVRTEIGVVRESVGAVDAKIVDVAAKQLAATAVAALLDQKVDSVKTAQAALKADVATIAPKLDQVQARQDAADQAANDLSLKLDDVGAKIDTQPKA